MNQFDRFQIGDPTDDLHYVEVDDGEAEREKADNDYDVAKGDL